MSSQCSSSTLSSTSSQSEQQPHPVLVLTDILEEIFSKVGTPQELLHYRLVCPKWNDVIVHTLVTKWKNCFPLRLRFGPDIPQFLLEHDAIRWAREILESPTMTLTGTGTTTPLSFDTVVVDRDFYLSGVNRQWQEFLTLHGESIRHLKFSIRSGKEEEAEKQNFHRVMGCPQLVSRQNLRVAFSTIPYLESLDFSVRFTQYGVIHELSRGLPQRMFPEARVVIDLPQMARLTKIIIQEPHGIQYVHGFLKEILGMAPNLTTLYIKYSKDLSNFASALRDIPHLNNSLTTLGISILDRTASLIKFDIQESGFSRFNLTKLELNSISGIGGNLIEFLQSQSSTLTSLILGDGETTNPGSYHRPSPGPYVRFGEIEGHHCNPLYPSALFLPPIMDSLKILDVNLSKFTLAAIRNYQNQFPALEELAFRNCEERRCVWKYLHVLHLFPEENGQSHTLKKFSLFGPMPGGSDRMNIMAGARSTFPFAEHHFGV